MGNEQFHISYSEHHMVVNFYQSLHIFHRRAELLFQITRLEELDNKSLLDTSLINRNNNLRQLYWNTFYNAHQLKLK